ncbi:MAG: ABC transporter permease [Acetobacteraceae bacterium]
MAQDTISIAAPRQPPRVRGHLPIGAIWGQILRFARRKPLGAFGGIVALLLIIVAVFAPFIATHDPNATNSALVFAPPSSEYWLGGDQVGRDVYSRLVYGARISLYAGLLSAFVGATIGMLIGVTSVHFGGVTDLIIQRIIDAMMAFPPIILAIAIMAALGASLHNVVIALSIAFIPSTARVLRSQALAVKEMNYILAAKAIGARHGRIIFRYMIPNCFALYIVLLTVFLGTAIVAEATLSFLGIGVPPDVPSWGGMLNGAAQTYVHLAPWLGVFPGLAIALVVFAWNLLGDALRDVLDPRLRGTG